MWPLRVHSHWDQLFRNALKAKCFPCPKASELKPSSSDIYVHTHIVVKHL